MSTDTLTVSSRNFYERTRAKVAISIITAAGSLFALGYCSSSGGLAKSYQDVYDDINDGDVKDAQASLIAGYGFAAFAFILAFLILLGAAIYVSPLFCGSNNEKKILRSPQEIDSGYSEPAAKPTYSPQV